MIVPLVSILIVLAVLALYSFIFWDIGYDQGWDDGYNGKRKGEK